MSNVRLSNGSPTLERMSARQSDIPKPSACRNLFGPVDHEELKKELNERLLQMGDSASAKWNFDFFNHTPLSNGTFEWEVVDSKNVPDFYNRPRPAPKGSYSTGNINVDLNGNRSCLLTTPCQENVGDRLSGEKSDSKMDCRDQCTVPRRRPADYESLSSPNKRSHTISDEVACFPVLTHSVEHTPRKSSPKRQT